MIKRPELWIARSQAADCDGLTSSGWSPTAADPGTPLSRGTLQMEAALACLARLDAKQGSNVAEVAKSVAEHLGEAVQGVQDLISNEAADLRDRITALGPSLMEQQKSNQAIIVGRFDKLQMQQGEILQEQRRLQNVENAMQASTNTFEGQFVYAPLFSPLEWKGLHGEDAAEDSDKVRSFLGRGSFSTTYRVRGCAGGTSGGGQLFAVKVVLSTDLRIREMGLCDLQKEVDALVRLPHVHITHFFRLFKAKETRAKDGFYLVMELAEGGTLAKRVCASLSVSDARQWSLQLVRVLEYIHGQGMAHRDLKPENVFLAKAADITLGEVVKLGDFGLAKDVGRGGSMSLSQAMTKVGTTNYFSPELESDGVKGSVRGNDMWALGCIVIELLRRERLDGPIWSSHPFVERKRGKLLDDARAADLGTTWEGRSPGTLGTAAAHMLVEYRMRCSASQLLRYLDPQPALGFECSTPSVPSLQVSRDCLFCLRT